MPRDTPQNARLVDHNEYNCINLISMIIDLMCAERVEFLRRRSIKTSMPFFELDFKDWQIAKYYDWIVKIV